MGATVERKKGDTSLGDVKSFLARLNGLNLNVGWFESAKYDADTPVAGVAAVQEFGSPKRSIPPRPFLRPTIEEKKGEWQKTLGKMISANLKSGGDPKNAMEVLGLSIVGDVKKTISTIQEPPLSPITLALRKQKLLGNAITGKTVGAVAKAIDEGETGPGELGDSSGINPKPLVFTGLLLNSITHEVSKK